MDEVDVDGFDIEYPACPLCKLPLSPRTVSTADGRLAVELYCPHHGPQDVWDPFAET